MPFQSAGESTSCRPNRKERLCSKIREDACIHPNPKSAVSRLFSAQCEPWRNPTFSPHLTTPSRHVDVEMKSIVWTYRRLCSSGPKCIQVAKRAHTQL